MIKLQLPFPPSVNAAYGNGGNKRGRHKTAVYKTWEKLAAIGVKDSHRQALGPYSISICLERPDKRRRDIDNYVKVLSDFIVAHGIVKDDSLCERLSMTWGVGLPSPCIVLIQVSEETVAA
jgi:crossover junction endodeoxyribonuclease RusA